MARNLSKYTHAARLRFRRQKLLMRARRKSLELSEKVNRTALIKKNDILLFSTVRNEKIRLPYFLQYYRNLGVTHFIFVDNASKDGTLEFLQDQDDCSVWWTEASYKSSRFGVDWMNALLRNYGTGHWCLTVDPDEFIVYPFIDTRPINALTDWLDDNQLKSFGTLLLDMYPKGAISERPYVEGEDPFKTAEWFDPGNYIISRNWDLDNLWIQGGPRTRKIFQHNPSASPSLNKIPLIRWSEKYAYFSSTHTALPRSLNRVYDDRGGEKTSGVLLHAKFLDILSHKTSEELERGEHYADSAEYRGYARVLDADPEFWCSWSERYINWLQLDVLGLMSRGNWA